MADDLVQPEREDAENDGYHDHVNDESVYDDKVSVREKTGLSSWTLSPWKEMKEAG